MIDPALLNLLPPLRRARGDRLYGPEQRHWVDLWKQDGAWLLGHRPDGAAKEWKNQLDKGLAAWAPSRWPQRLEFLVRQILPDVTVRLFRNADRAPEAVLWRPWSGLSDPAPVIRLILPSGPCQAVAVAYSSAWRGKLPDHDVTSPAEAAGLVQAAAQVLRFSRDDRAETSRRGAGETFDRVVGPSNLFRRHGLWLFPLMTPEEYTVVFRRHFEAGFFLNPDPQAPSLLPTALSEGEWAAWREAVQAPRGGL